MCLWWTKAPAQKAFMVCHYSRNFRSILDSGWNYKYSRTLITAIQDCHGDHFGVLWWLFYQVFWSVLYWRCWSDEYSGGLVRLMQGLHGEWVPWPTSPTVTHTKTPRRGRAIHCLWGNTFSDLRFAQVFSEIYIWFKRLAISFGTFQYLFRSKYLFSQLAVEWVLYCKGVIPSTLSATLKIHFNPHHIYLFSNLSYLPFFLCGISICEQQVDPHQKGHKKTNTKLGQWEKHSNISSPLNFPSFSFVTFNVSWCKTLISSHQYLIDLWGQWRCVTMVACLESGQITSIDTSLAPSPPTHAQYQPIPNILPSLSGKYWF